MSWQTLAHCEAVSAVSAVLHSLLWAAFAIQFGCSAVGMYYFGMTTTTVAHSKDFTMRYYYDSIRCNSAVDINCLVGCRCMLLMLLLERVDGVFCGDVLLQCFMINGT